MTRLTRALSLERIRTAMPDRELLYWSLSWCIAVFWMAYWVENPFFAFLLALPTLAVGAGLLFFGLWRGWELRHSRIRALSTALLFPLLALGWPLIFSAAAHVHFLQDRRIYEEIIKLEQRGYFGRNAGPGSEYGGVEFAVDRSSGVKRFAFTTNSGVMDNWAAVIYDPSDEVRLAQGLNAAPPHIRMLFGGDLVACRSLTDHYYSCSFT